MKESTKTLALVIVVLAAIIIGFVATLLALATDQPLWTVIKVGAAAAASTAALGVAILSFLWLT